MRRENCNKDLLDLLEFCLIDKLILIISYLYQYLSIISLYLCVSIALSFLKELVYCPVHLLNSLMFSFITLMYIYFVKFTSSNLCIKIAEINYCQYLDNIKKN